MATRRRSLPSLDDAGRMVFQLTLHGEETVTSQWNSLPKEVKKHYVKLAIEIWREVEKCI